MTDRHDRPTEPRQSFVSPLASEPSCVPLDAALTTVVQDPRLSDTFRALFAGELRAGTVGWPCRVEGRAAPAWLRDGDVLVELSRAPQSEPLELAISLRADVATCLVEALLGAKVSSRLASAAGQPSEAECGVLAYAAARLLASHGAAWIVRDVRRSSVAARLQESPRVLWPVSVESSLGKLEATLWLSPALANSLGGRHALEVLLHEQLREASELTAGEVWLSDDWPLTNTTDGLLGPVTLRVPGCATMLGAQLSKHHVQLSADRLAPRKPSPDASGSRANVEVVIATRGVSLTELAELRSGSRCFVGEVGSQTVLLSIEGQPPARGELVIWRGALGVRITQG
jgi:flagellar motor switch/type III secretory pathway protein FliN